MKNLHTRKTSNGSNFGWLIRQMSINQKSGRKTFRRRFVSGSVFVSPCPPECYYQAKRNWAWSQVTPKWNAIYVWNSFPYPTKYFLPLPQSLYGWTEYAYVIIKFSGIERFEKEINCKNRKRRSCKLSGLLKKAGIASRNTVIKEQ